MPSSACAQQELRKELESRTKELASATAQHQSELMQTQSDAQALLFAEKSSRQELRGVLQQTEVDAARRLNDQQREAHQQKLNQTNEVSIVSYL